mgnify:CR=1 FL=1
MVDKVQEDIILSMDCLIRILRSLGLLEVIKVYSSRNSSKLQSKTFKNI